MGLYDRACPGRRTIRFGPGDVCHSRVVGNAAIRETNRCAIAVRQLGTAQITPLTDAMEIENTLLLLLLRISRDDDIVAAQPGPTNSGAGRRTERDSTT
jgi:hypothetical protein